MDFLSTLISQLSIAQVLQALDYFHQLRRVVQRIHLWYHGQNGPISIEDIRSARRSNEGSSIHRFWNEGIGGAREMVVGITHERVADILRFCVTRVRSARIPTQSQKIESGAIEFGGMRDETLVLPIAAWCVVLHVDRHDSPPREQLSERHLFDHAIIHDLKSKTDVHFLAGRDHTTSETVDRRGSNLSTPDKSRHWLQSL